MHIVSGFDSSNQLQNISILNVLYVEKNLKESNLNSQSNFKNINLTYCDSLYDASKLLETKDFDVIVCDLNFDFDSLKSFFYKYGDKFPIIAFSSTIDPTLAYTAAKIGAVDFIYKNKDNLQNITNIILQIHNNWIKKKNKNKIGELIKDPDNLLIIKNIVHTDLPITQRITSSYSHEFHINNIIKKNYNINTNEVISKRPDVLESFVNMDILKKEPIEQTLVCPNCDSVDISPHYCCNECDGSLFTKKRLLFHTICKEFIAFEQNVQAGVSCPKCLTYFTDNPLEWKDMLGFNCTKCNNLFVKPTIYYSCNNCSLDSFTSNEGNWTTLFEYNLNGENIEKLKNDIFILDDLENYLKKIGFSIDYYKKYICDGKNYGPFDLAASNDRKSLLFVILGYDIEKNLEKIFEIESLEKNLKQNMKFFAISFSKPSQALLYLLKKFNIIPLFFERNTDISQYIKNYF